MRNVEGNADDHKKDGNLLNLFCWKKSKFRSQQSKTHTQYIYIYII